MFRLFKKKKPKDKLKQSGNVPKVFADKYPYKKEDTTKTVERFNKDFGLDKFVLPKGFIEFVETKKWYGFIKEGVPEFETIPYEKIIDAAYDLIMGSDVFMLPPFCIPFGDGETGHETYALDYLQCGIDGEPQVILVCHESIEYEDNEDVSTYNFNKVTIPNFEKFFKILKER